MNGNLLWGGLAGLAIRENWDAIEKFLSELALLLQQPYPSLQPPPVQVELPPPQPLQDPDESDRIVREFLKGYRLGGEPTSSVENSPRLGVLDYQPPADALLAQMVHHPAAVLVSGHRGSGKTATIMRLQELLRDVAPPYAIGLPDRAASLLPQWYGLADDPVDVPTNSTIYFPESYRFFHSRSTQSQMGRSLSDLVNLSRHRRQTLFFDVQNTAQLDRNIISEVDLILVKEPGPFHLGFERQQLRPVIEAARAAFAGIGQHRKKKAVWVFNGSTGHIMENSLPSFWSEVLSRIFAAAGPVRGSLSAGSAVPAGPTRAKPRKAQTTPTGIKASKVLRLTEAGHTRSEVGNMLGISKSYVQKLLKMAQNGRKQG